MDNPWNIQSIYELQYFKCPSCEFIKHYSKQELINHASESHPESIEYLRKINDNSLYDVTFPWNSLVSEIKIEEQNLDEKIDLVDNLSHKVLLFYSCSRQRSE